MKSLQQSGKNAYHLNNIYIAKVVANNDTKYRNRIQVRILGLIDDDTLDSDCPYAEQASLTFSGTSETIGISSVPNIGSYVYVQFLYGDPSHPIYTGVVRGSEDASQLQKNKDLANTINSIRQSNIIGPELAPLNSSTVYPENNVIETKSGNVIELDDTTGNERISISHNTGSYIEIRPDGTVGIKTNADYYEIVKGNIERYTDGAENVVVIGNKTEAITGDTNEIHGSKTIDGGSAFTVNAGVISLN